MDKYALVFTHRRLTSQVRGEETRGWFVLTHLWVSHRWIVKHWFISIQRALSGRTWTIFGGSV
jgi:hypothetical protein